MKNGDKPAFLERIILHPSGGNEKSFGLTKREYFAAKALSGILSHPAMYMAAMPSDAVKEAISLADELLKQLEQ